MSSVSKLSKSYLRSDHEPRIVDLQRGQVSPRNAGRSHSNNYDYRDRHRFRRKDLYFHNQTNAFRSTPTVTPKSHLVDQTEFVLDVVRQPTKRVDLGTPVEFAVLLSLRWPSFNAQPSASSIDTSNLLAAASLVGESNHGERIPLQAGMLTAPTLFDTVHSASEDHFEPPASDQPYRMTLGYLSFPDLVIRQAGTYRIRTTILRMGISEEPGATSLLAVDSRPIHVERQSCAS